MMTQIGSDERALVRRGPLYPVCLNRVQAAYADERLASLDQIVMCNVLGQIPECMHMNFDVPITGEDGGTWFVEALFVFGSRHLSRDKLWIYFPQRDQLQYGMRTSAGHYIVAYSQGTVSDEQVFSVASALTRRLTAQAEYEERKAALAAVSEEGSIAKGRIPVWMLMCAAATPILLLAWLLLHKL